MSAQLNEIAVGVVVVGSGQAIPLSKPHHNIFIHEEDEGQVPLCFLKEVIDLFSSAGDWVLAGPRYGNIYWCNSNICVHSFMYVCACVYACV